MPLLSGCIIFPHSELAAPAAFGRVLDSKTSQPIEHAKVFRNIGGSGKSSFTFTRSDGVFDFKRSTVPRWLTYIDYAANIIDYRVEASGYEVFTTNLNGGGSFLRGERMHDLGMIFLQSNCKKADYAKRRAMSQVCEFKYDGRANH
jgi:hypothetical protein